MVSVTNADLIQLDQIELPTFSENPALPSASVGDNKSSPTKLQSCRQVRL